MMDRQNEQKLTGQPDFGRVMPDKPFLTIGEVANILQVSSRTVYNLIYKGTLRACRITYHITLITKEDFFLMIKETTYCKRSVSLFAKQNKKTKKKMEEERQDIGETNTSRQEGKNKTKDSPTKRKLKPATNYKQSVRDAVLNTVHQSQLHQVFSEIGSGQGDGRRKRAFGQQPFGTLVFVLRHHAPVRIGQDPSPQVRTLARSKDEAHTRQSLVLSESRLGCGT